ncbi:hypothetical protein EVAR_10820_1 [Eumeta japonica]|uniref:Uncharacterized protein n=1 Tax=Eumeta variegata TaxID=151549 RepID=A0A4C1YAQ8_EUMVA|nr:hypothetical protein EVAR_10820_1 [Eumeta japonica]
MQTKRTPRPRAKPGRGVSVAQKEGSIGHDLVIRPVPDSMTASAQDDEMFMDPASMGDMVSIDTGLPIDRPSPAHSSYVRTLEFSILLLSAVRRHPLQQERIRRALAGARHVIIKRDPAADHQDSDFAFMEPDHISKRFRRKRSTTHVRRKREAPYVIYPEILVVVDYDGYR